MRLLGYAKLLLSLQFEAIEGEGHSLAEISGIHQPAATGGILAQNQAVHRVSDYGSRLGNGRRSGVAWINCTNRAAIEYKALINKLIQYKSTAILPTHH